MAIRLLVAHTRTWLHRILKIIMPHACMPIIWSAKLEMLCQRLRPHYVRLQCGKETLHVANKLDVLIVIKH